MECTYCKKECKNNNAKAQHERFCKLNPNRVIMTWHAVGDKVSHVAWNKGLTKESDERIAQYGKTYSERCSGENNALFGRKLPEETKAKIAAKQKENYRGISRYATVREQRKSYAERYFDKIFTGANKQYHVDRFFLDYAWPERKEYIEVDGEQHYTPEGIAHDVEREKILTDLGWTCKARIRWANWQKMTKSEKVEFLCKLL